MAEQKKSPLKKMSKFYLTTPIYYVNSEPHIGHAYTNIISDCTARYQRLKGNQVFFLTGTDEHGEKIKKAAEAQQQEVKVFIDNKAEIFRKLWEKLNISNDFFIRTTDDFHKQVVQVVVSKLIEKGDIYKAKYKGFYCTPCEGFWTPVQVKEAGGCPDCKREVQLIEEDNYFFKLSKYQDWLVSHLKNNPGFAQPKSRYNEVSAFLEKNKLEDLCISRPKKRLSWGVAFPGDDQYVIYVWFDALINYISGAGYSIDQEKFSRLWPAEIHFMAKDILRHHAIFWPIMLKALDLELPKVVFAHGWWKFEGEKMSKSRGNIVNPFDVIETLAISLSGSKEMAVDALRYFLLREVPIGSDGTFSWPALFNRTNSDLANDLGNLVYRTLNMAEKYFEGKVKPSKSSLPFEFKQSLGNLEARYSELMDSCAFSVALEEVFGFIRAMNKFIEDSKPWTLWKEKKVEELENFLYYLLEGIRISALYLSAAMPNAAKSIYSQLGLTQGEFSLASAKWGTQKEFKIKKEKPLFPRIDAD
ncbi:MAG: methionine--tRNA ligase [Candidatus Omnitrophica bacterium]|nr:methionine--tRNA ligase [Candidatus Omnitrophota bacterium]